MTQCERVLAAAQRPQGVCQVELNHPDRYGLPGAPITRLAARVQDLEDRGFEFELVGWRKSTRVYRLHCSAGTRTVGRDSPVCPPDGVARDSRPVPVPPGRLFDPPSEPHWRAA